jgi:hypothetical protein
VALWLVVRSWTIKDRSSGPGQRAGLYAIDIPVQHPVQQSREQMGENSGG